MSLPRSHRARDVLGPANGGQPSQRYRDSINPPAPYEPAKRYIADSELGPAMAALNDRQRAFVLALIQTGCSRAEAARVAGYEGDADTLKAGGYRLAHSPKVQAAMAEEAVKLMRDTAFVMVEVLRSIAVNPQADPKDRIKAAGELLSRSGLGAITEHRIEVTHKTDAQRDPQLVAAEIVKMGRALGLDLDPGHLLGPPPTDVEFEEVTRPDIPPELADII